MTDRELLEAAAKAAGMTEFRYIERGFAGGAPLPQELWNPLHNDGDALRLAVTLGMSMSLYRKPNETWCSIGINAGCSEMHDADPYAATRRAIVRAAAAMVEPVKVRVG